MAQDGDPPRGQAAVCGRRARGDGDAELELELLAHPQVADVRRAGGRDPELREPAEQPGEAAVDDGREPFGIGDGQLHHGVLGLELADLGDGGHQASE